MSLVVALSDKLNVDWKGCPAASNASRPGLTSDIGAVLELLRVFKQDALSQVTDGPY